MRTLVRSGPAERETPRLIVLVIPAPRLWVRKCRAAAGFFTVLARVAVVAPAVGAFGLRGRVMGQGGEWGGIGRDDLPRCFGVCDGAN